MQKCRMSAVGSCMQDATVSIPAATPLPRLVIELYRNVLYLGC